MWNGLEDVRKDEIIPTLSSLPFLFLETGIALRELRYYFSYIMYI